MESPRLANFIHCRLLMWMTLDLDFKESKKLDQFGNEFRYRAKIERFKTGIGGTLGMGCVPIAQPMIWEHRINESGAPQSAPQKFLINNPCLFLPGRQTLSCRFFFFQPQRPVSLHQRMDVAGSFVNDRGFAIPQISLNWIVI